MRLLDELSLGGCLADDMGLGKTIQTLCLMQWMKEQNGGLNLLVVPTSLIYNWNRKQQNLTPQIKVHVHAGNQRTRNAEDFKMSISYLSVMAFYDAINSFNLHSVSLRYTGRGSGHQKPAIGYCDGMSVSSGKTIPHLNRYTARKLSDRFMVAGTFL